MLHSAQKGNVPLLKITTITNFDVYDIDNSMEVKLL